MIWPDINIHLSNENFLEFELISFFFCDSRSPLIYVDSGIPGQQEKQKSLIWIFLCSKSKNPSMTYTLSNFYLVDIVIPFQDTYLPKQKFKQSPNINLFISWYDNFV